MAAVKYADLQNNRYVETEHTTSYFLMSEP